MSTCPPRAGRLGAEKNAIPRLCSSAPTAMISGLLAGDPTNPTLPARRSALFPAAAMSGEPPCTARLPAARGPPPPLAAPPTGRRVRRVRLHHGGTQGHRQHVAAVGDRPVDAGEDL